MGETGQMLAFSWSNTIQKCDRSQYSNKPVKVLLFLNKYGLIDHLNKTPTELYVYHEPTHIHKHKGACTLVQTAISNNWSFNQPVTARIPTLLIEVFRLQQTLNLAAT